MTSPAVAICVPPRRVLYSTPSRPGAVEQDAMDEGARRDGEVLAVHHRVEIGARRTEPPAASDVAIELGETLLLEPVDVVGDRVPRLLDSFEEGAEQWVGRRAAFQLQRPAVPAELIAAVRREAVLHLLEVRQAVGIVPGLHARIGCPPFVVEGIAALEDHPVDAARTTEHLAAGVVDLAAVHERLRLALVLPVVELAADREGQRRRHVDEDIPLVVGAAGLEHQHVGARVCAEPIGQCRAGGSATDDHIVVSGHVVCGHNCTRSAAVATSRPTSFGVGVARETIRGAVSVNRADDASTAVANGGRDGVEPVEELFERPRVTLGRRSRRTGRVSRRHRSACRWQVRSKGWSR